MCEWVAGEIRNKAISASNEVVVVVEAELGKIAVKLASHRFRGSRLFNSGQIRKWCPRQHPED